MELASLMEYEPNPYAINLRTNRSKTFGLIVPEISNYFYHSFISAVEEDARKMGYSLLILQSGDNPEMELENLRICRMNRIAALMVCLTSQTKDIKPFLKLDDSGIPVIFFDKVPSFEACNRVCVADAEAGSIAASTLIEANKKNILAIFGNPDLLITQKRQHAFMAQIALATDPIPVTIRYAHDNKKAMQQMLQAMEADSKPDAVFCMSDEILTGVMKIIQIKKYKVPEDISVISICNNGFIPCLYEPEITYVETSGYDLGKLAVKRIFDHMNGKTFVQELTVPSRLVKGNSVS
jgi:LacI family transcriptional regulator